MHIAEGFLPPLQCAAWFAVAAPFVSHGGRAVVREARKSPENRLLLAAAGAFTFVLSAIKLPSVTGSCSHPTGTGLGALLFGPAAMAPIGAVVLLFQALLLAHAQCRLAARDPQLLALAYALIVLMPWNLPLWWQLHRLRFAIEVDCDARMLAHGHALRDYATVLRRHGQYYSGLTGAAPIVLGDPRALRRRRHLMARFTGKPAANLL